MAEHIVGDHSELNEFFGNLYGTKQCPDELEHDVHTWTDVDGEQRWCEGFYPTWTPDDVDRFLEG